MKYETPILEITYFGRRDVVTISILEEGSDEPHQDDF